MAVRARPRARPPRPGRGGRACRSRGTRFAALGSTDPAHRRPAWIHALHPNPCARMPCCAAGGSRRRTPSATTTPGPSVAAPSTTGARHTPRPAEAPEPPVADEAPAAGAPPTTDPAERRVCATAPCSTCSHWPSPPAAWWPRSPGRRSSPWGRSAARPLGRPPTTAWRCGRCCRAAGRRCLSWLRPRSVLWLPVLVARTVLLAIALPALLWAFRWLVVEGTHGLVAAARTGVWSDGFRAASASSASCW